MNLGIFIFEALKKEFWLKRCNEVNEIERKLNVTKADKRIRKLKDRDLTDDKKIDNHSKKLKIDEKIKNRENTIKLVTKNRILGKYTEGKDTRNWNLTPKIV